MDSLLDSIGEQLAEADAHRNYSVLLRIIDNILEHPNEAKFRSVSRSELQEKLHTLSFQLLEALGFVPNGGGDLALPPDADLDPLQTVQMVLQAVALSTEEPTPMELTATAPAAVSTGGDEGDDDGDDDDDDLAEAMKLSLQPSEKRDREVAEELSRDDEPAKIVSFHRFDHQEKEVDQDTVNNILQQCAITGAKYVDPQFPPVPRSLYMDQADATTWTCLRCGARTDLPPVPKVARTREEAEAAEALWHTQNKCSGCGGAAHHVINVRHFTRPTQWLRPAERCEGCELIYSHLPGGKELVSRMCTHHLRDSVTNTTVGSPWKIIRGGEARPEDVCQGGLGNCWFAAALGTVANKPELIDRMFVTKDINAAGAYHLRLFHAGEWRDILIDDLFPTSQIFEGYTDATHVYYSLGGSLCYLQGARRQIWVPLVEKAAAKLYGCWATMCGGTFAEAMSLFTGFPTDRIQGLYIRKEQRRRLQERRQQRAEERTQMLIQGLDVPPAQEDSDDDIDNDAIAWSKIMSANEAGYLMGMGCTEEGCEKTREHLVEEKGLACPHAYGILDAREVQVDGKQVRLIKLRNPWGERAPRTWLGDWGKDSKLWTRQLQLELGVINSSGVKMEEDMGIFWMSFEDVREYFSAVEVCRVHQSWHEVRQRAWLPSGVGPGDAFELTVFRKTQVDIVLWQEKNITREGALGARSTNIDVGLAVLRSRGVGADGQPEYELIEYIARSNSDDCSGEMILEGGFVYRLVPISFGLMQELAPRRAVVAVHSAQRVELKKVDSSWYELACGAFEGCRKGGKKRPVPTMAGPAPGLSSYLRFEEGCGLCFAVENTSDVGTAIQFDGSDCTGCSFTRGTSLVITAVPPRSRQVIMGVAPDRAGNRAVPVSMGIAAVSLGPEQFAFGMPGDMMHMSLQLLSPDIRHPGNRMLPDESILKRAPPEEPEHPPTAKRANTNTQSISSSSNLDEELAEAIRMSMGAQPQTAKLNEMTDVGDDEDELASAIRLSMMTMPSVEPLDKKEVTTTAATACQQSSPARPPDTVEQKKKFQELVKRCFEECRRGGMSPQESAVKALAKAKEQAARGE